jgi:hypothetical protein
VGAFILTVLKMEYKKMIGASEMVYSLEPASVSAISAKTGLNHVRVRKIKEGIEMYLDSEATLEEISQKVDLPLGVVKDVISRFFERCVEAYGHYQEQVAGSISGSAEAVGINRFYFEDWFWKNAVDSTDDEGKRCLARLKAELKDL